MNKKQAIYLHETLKAWHPNAYGEFAIAQVGYAAIDDKSTNMHDDTCNIITSDEFKRLGGSTFNPTKNRQHYVPFTSEYLNDNPNDPEIIKTLGELVSKEEPFESREGCRELTKEEHMYFIKYGLKLMN